MSLSHVDNIIWPIGETSLMDVYNRFILLDDISHDCVNHIDYFGLSIAHHLRQGIIKITMSMSQMDNIL